MTEYRASGIALFYPKTEQFTEYDLPPRTYPYRAQVDKNGEHWTGGMSSDRSLWHARAKDVSCFPSSRSGLQIARQK